jgi:hypothetical protein
MINLDLGRAPNRLPNYVHDVSTATCVFCPYGANVKAGDRIVAFDEKTAFGRRQRERLVEVIAVKSFRSTGRLITLDLKIAKEDEIAHIAEDSELPVEALFEHRIGAATYMEDRPPVVVYFRPCNEEDTIGLQFRKRSRHRHH